MLRSLMIPAAAALITLPAAAQTVRIPVTGKTDAEVTADVQRAVRALCRQAVIGATFPADEFRACVQKMAAGVVRRPVPATETRMARR